MRTPQIKATSAMILDIQKIRFFHHCLAEQPPKQLFAQDKNDSRFGCLVYLSF
jgi:hypothetical protein